MSRFAFFIGLAMISQCAFAGEIYVDNIVGRDGDDGTLPEIREGHAGPVKSLERAAKLAGFGDAIILRNTGVPYYGSLSLTGERHSGTRLHPFMVIGNGASISGLRAVDREGWRKIRGKLWRLTSTRKGYYQLLRNGQLLTEYIPEGGVDPLEALGPGQWVSWHGHLYFRQDGIDPPTSQDFALTADQTGISLHQVSNVVIADVTIQHFRFDGIHAQGLCDGIELDDVNSIENGRAGVVSSGASTIEIFGGIIERNGRHQTLTFDRSKVIPHE